MQFLEIIQNCLQIFGISIRFLDFSIRFLFEISPKVHEIFSSDTPLECVNPCFLGYTDFLPSEEKLYLRLNINPQNLQVRLHIQLS